MRARRSERALVLIACSALTSAVLATTPSRAGAAAGDISTIAGGLGEGPAATLAQTPLSVSVAGTKVYVSDSAYHVVREIDRSNGDQQTVIAGNGTAGTSGDGGPATAARLDMPSGVAVANDGTLFIVDSAANRVRRVDPAGVITTVVGVGTAGFSGDSGPATAAELNGPTGVAVDTANPPTLYIADQVNQRVRKVDAAGVITTVAGTGFAGQGLPGPATVSDLNYPSGVAVDSAGGLYIADTGNSRVQEVIGGAIVTVAGGLGSGDGGDGGPAVLAPMRGPTGVTVDNALPANIYILDTFNRMVRRVDGTTRVITVVAGNGTRGYSGDGGPATAAQLNTAPSTVFSYGVAVDSANRVLVADFGNSRLRQIDAGTITTVAGTGRACCYSLGPGPATSAQLGFPSELALDAAGSVYVSESTNHRVRRVDPSGSITTVAGTGEAGFSGDGGPATAAQLNAPYGVAVDRAGNLFLADANNNRVRRVDPAGVITTVAGTGAPGFSGDGGPATAARLNSPYAVTFDRSGNLLIADTSNRRVRRVDPAGVITTVAGNGSYGFGGDGGAATAAKLSSVFGVALDRDGRLLLADLDNHRVRRVDTAGVITTIVGTGVAGSGGDGEPATVAQLRSPAGIAVDGTGNLFVADFGGHRVRKVDHSGTISTVAGQGSQGFSGDGGPARDAQLDSPTAVATAPSGDLYIADAGNNRVRRAPGLASSDRRATSFDFDGDGSSDVAVFRPDGGGWFVRGGLTMAWGGDGDVPVAADYDGDGKSDVAIFRPATGLWAIHGSAGSDTFVTYGGLPGDVAVPADYDGDGRADIAVYRPSVGTWYVHRSGDGADTAATYGGLPGDVPIPADYDGDGRADIAIFRAGTWYVHGTAGTDTTLAYGAAGDVAVPADYDGDGRADIAVFRPSTGLWAIHPTNGDPDTLLTYGGAPGDVAVPADYDGDGRADVAVFRPPNGIWFVHGTTSGDIAAPWGLPSDVPVTATRERS